METKLSKRALKALEDKRIRSVWPDIGQATEGRKVQGPADVRQIICGGQLRVRDSREDKTGVSRAVFNELAAYCGMPLRKYRRKPPAAGICVPGGESALRCPHCNEWINLKIGLA